MGLKNFTKKVNELANKDLENKFDKKLSGVKIYDESKIQKEGYRLFDGILMDYKGKKIKQFSHIHLGTIHNKKYLAQKLYETKPWGLFDLNDKKIWTKNETIHHEIKISPDDTVFVFSAEKKIYKGKSIDFDIIREYDFKGKLISKWSSYDNLDELQKFHKKMPLDTPKIFKSLLKKRERKSPWGGEYGFYYHFNSINFIPKNNLEKKDKRFQNGNWIISCRHGSIIFIIDKKTKMPIYALTQNDIKENIEGQHDVQMLQNGNLLIFDNGLFRRYSRVIEINPITKKIEFEYKDKNFLSKYRGSVQKLPNGNYLIADSQIGRAFEITKNKKIVWEYYHEEKQDKTNSKFPESFGKRQVIYRMKFYSKSDVK